MGEKRKQVGRDVVGALRGWLRNPIAETLERGPSRPLEFEIRNRDLMRSSSFDHALNRMREDGNVSHTSMRYPWSYLSWPIRPRSAYARLP